MKNDAFIREACGDRRPNPPINLADTPRQEFSGHIIVRLEADLAAELDNADDLRDVAQRLGLDDLSRILEEHNLEGGRRVVQSLSPNEVRELERRAAQTDFPPLHSLTSYWRLDARHLGDRPDEVVARLNRAFGVNRAYRELNVTDPVVNAADDPYNATQDYLDAAPTGIDARWAWTQPNGEGAGIGFVDLEQGWFLTHEDFASKSPTLIYGDNRDGVGSYKGNHGTAVMGQVGADDNTLGVVGGAPSIASMRATSHYDATTSTALHVADALVAAIPVMNLGDIILLEVQRGFPPLPTETDDADFDAIRLASALGLVVVEAAGNGNNDLDAYTNGVGDSILNRGDADFRESGAIMVGAGESALPHNRSSFSNFGSRIDCYGWGDGIVTCGYGDLDDGGGDDDKTYTDTFGGTSGASPMVTTAALILQGMYEATMGTRLSPGQMRSLLSNPVTGTAQGGGTAGNIGVMPDLRAIITNTLGLTPDIYVRDNVGDTGATPSSGGISTSPDIIVRPSLVADPAAAFGEGSGTENSASLGYEVESGQDNYLYVRMRNRGGNDANGVTATVYWSEVSTLVTPDMWNLIGTTAPVNAPQGDTLVVTNPLTWDKNDIPATGHYCFVGILDHPQDEAPPLPPGPPNFDWGAFTDYIRNHNNVTWRNFNVVDVLPDPSVDPAELPFQFAGAPDRSRTFDFEIDLRLPRGARAILEVPLHLAKRLVRGRNWEVEKDRDANVARIHLPPQPRLAMCDVRMGRGDRVPARFLVQGPEQGEHPRPGRHTVAIRQFHEALEVGRVTWQFGREQEEGPARFIVPFEQGEVRIRSKFEGVLERVARQLEANPELRLLVAGHAADADNPEDDLELSTRRARAVAEMLNERFGVDEDRMAVQGVGPFAPRVRGRAAADSPENRRVELLLR